VAVGAPDPHEERRQREARVAIVERRGFGAVRRRRKSANIVPI
jgi:hypothetical protein